MHLLNSILYTKDDNSLSLLFLCVNYMPYRCYMFDIFTTMVHKRIMKKNRLLLNFICVLFVPSALLAVAFPLEYQLPFDEYIKQVVEEDPSSVEEQTRRALQSSYGPSFIAFVPQSVQSAFVATYNDILASILPASNIQIGKARERNNIFEVPFSIHQELSLYGTFVWTKNEEGQFVLLSLSINQREI